jgi:hypothetical protein
MTGMMSTVRSIVGSVWQKTSTGGCGAGVIPMVVSRDGSQSALPRSWPVR